MAKIAIDARFLCARTHGISRYIKNLLLEFETISSGHSFFILYNKEPLFFDKNKFFLKKISSGKFSLKGQIEIPQALKAISPDLFHVPSIDIPLFQNYPTIISIHDLIPFILPQYYPAYSFLYLPVLRYTAKRARIIIVPSGSTAGDVNRILKIPFEKIRIIPDAAEKQFSKKGDPEEDGLILEKFKIHEDFFLTVINDRPHKNLNGLLKAFFALKENKCQLAIVGKIDDCFHRLVKKAGFEQRVLFLGYVSDAQLASLYRTCLVFVFPSIYEGFGLPPLEALACGAAVISSNTSSLPEVVGQAGLFIEPGNSASIAEAMLKILHDVSLREDLKDKALKRASLFSWKKTAQLTLKAYEEAIK